MDPYTDILNSLVKDWARLSRSHREEIDPNCKRGIFFVTYPLHEAVKQGNVPRQHCFRPFGKRTLTEKRGKFANKRQQDFTPKICTGSF